eukprot:CAMPEP_0202965368 /NCGR_PEP_ID=MMETSP1396-20130829/9365_1 /ASSEMBLY_ACC=CAM_ASM_000872 /TAXON_ID= /ORGANISM="Pseudokeronopsis sp., Strain Brazil" /LENGTH=86 /DNA_ID=CAMNT_0049688057 /DNA_START=114 /DNA_END=374 /DNA_ORIENTATION=+
MTQEDQEMQDENGDDLEDNSERPLLEEIMDDDDFIAEIVLKNELLLKFLDEERLLEMIDFLIIEPSFTDSPIRCYKLPFQACQALC